MEHILKKTFVSWLSILGVILVVSGCDNTQNSSTDQTSTDQTSTDQTSTDQTSTDEPTQETNGSSNEGTEETLKGIQKISADEIQKIRSIKVLSKEEDIKTDPSLITSKKPLKKELTKTNPSMFVSQKHLRKIKAIQLDTLKKQKSIIKPKVNKYKENEVIVLLKKNKESQILNKIKKDKSLKILKNFKLKTKVGEKIFLHIKSKNLSTDKLIKKLKGAYYIESVSPNYIYQLDSTPNDSGSQYQWGFNNTAQGFPPYHWLKGTADADIDAEEAWNIRTDSTSVVAAVIDTGVDYNNEDLTGNMWINPGEIANNGLDDDGNGFVDDYYGVNTASNRNSQAEGDPMDVNGHGTHVAGSVGAKGNNAKGVSGVNWDIKVMGVNAYMPGEGFYSDDLLEAVQYILDAKTDGVNVVVVNASYGGGGGSQGDTMAQAIASLGDAGIIFVAAAGNDGVDNDGTPHYPSSYEESNIIAVANTDYNDAYVASSCYGVTSVDVSAPGSYILSTKWSGGSMAPHEVDEQWYQSQEGGWSHGGTNDNWDLITKDIVYFEGSNTCWSDSSGDYSPNTNATLDSPVFDLSNPVGSDLSLFFYITGKITDTDDRLYIEFWNSNTSNWDSQGYLSQDFSAGIYSIPVVIDSSYHSADFRVRFRMVSDSDANVDDGYYIDDVSVGSGTYRVIGGTSMASPHVTGAIAMLAAEFPDENITVRKDRILASSDPLSTIGKTVSDGRLNLFNALQNPALVHITSQNGTPDAGDRMTAGDSFTLDGHSFGDTEGKVEFVDGDDVIVEATVTSWTDTQITATVPSGYPGKHIKVARSTESKSGYFDGSRWSNETALSNGFDSAATVSSDGKIYAIGGQSSFSDIATLHIFDPSTGIWSTGTDIPTPRSYAAVTVLNGNIYVMGGYSQSSGQVVDTVEIYNIASNSWGTGTPLPESLAFARASVLNGDIYISGGTTNGAYATDSLYKLSSGVWSQETDMPNARMGHGMIEHSGHLYIFGGADWDYQIGAEYTQSKKMYIYNPAGTGSWTDSLKDLPIALARFGFSKGVEGTDTAIKIAGGTADTAWWTSQLQTVMTYNFTTGEWYQTNEGLDELIVNKIGSSMVFIDGQGFYNIGGYSEVGGTLDDFEKYE